MRLTLDDLLDAPLPAEPVASEWRRYLECWWSGRRSEALARAAVFVDRLNAASNAGEGPHVEFKSQLPEGNSDTARRTMLKTVAAFASGNGGTILFGVRDDDGVVAGLDPATIDQQRGRLVNMIRDLVVPGPAYRITVEEIDGLPVLALEVHPGQRGGYALFPDRPEFYVRRGATTYRARVDEIASAYCHR